MYGTITFPVGILAVRCLILCKNMTVTKFRIFLTILSCFLVSSFLVHASFEVSSQMLPYSIFEEFLNACQINNSLFKMDHIIMGSLATLENWKFVLIDVFINSTIYSTTIVVSIYNYIKYMKRVSSKISEVTRRLHLDFLKIIILQSIVPFMITFPSIFIFLIYAQLGYSNKIPFLGDILVKFMCAVPSINAVLYIFLPSKNRNKFFLFVKNTLQRKSLSNISETFIISSQRYSIDPTSNIKGSRVLPYQFNGYSNLNRNRPPFYKRKVSTV